MARPPLEVADVFRANGAAWRKANAGHVGLAQLKVMSAIETCRTAALGGHVERCEDCAHERISYNSCRNRHCPKCQAAAARQWLEDREAELLPVPYYHVVFTLPASIGAIAFHNKAAVYDLLIRTAAETLTAIAADPKHLGARIGLTAVLHTWGSAMTHHPHVHVIVPGGGLSSDGSRWVACKPGFFLPVRVLSRLFRRLFLEGIAALHAAGRLAFFGDFAPLADKPAFDAALAPLRGSEWVVYAKRPFAGPKAVLAYLSRYTHRVAISNSRLIRLDDKGVTFRWKDYRLRGKAPGKDWIKPMTLAADEFIRRFLLHVLPSGFHRIRHYGFLAGSRRTATIDRLRELIAAADCNLSAVPTSRMAPPPPITTTLQPRPRSVPAAADACAPSRPSPAALTLAASTPNLPESTRHDRRPGPRHHRHSPADDSFLWRVSVRAQADRGDQPRAPSRRPTASRRPSADPTLVRRPRASGKHALAIIPHGAVERQIPIAASPPQTLTVPRFPPLEAFGRRPSGPTPRPRQGRHPKPCTIAVIHRGHGERSQMTRSVHSTPGCQRLNCNETARSLTAGERLQLSRRASTAERHQMELDLPNDPDREFVVSIDTAHVRASRAEAGRNFEIVVARCGRGGRGSRPGRYFTTADTSKRELQSRTLQALQSEGYAGRGEVTVLSDGAEIMKRLPKALPQPTTHIIDWFHIAMKIQPLQQIADHVVRWSEAGNSEMAHVDADVRSLKWKLWHGQTDRALDQLETMTSEFAKLREEAIFQRRACCIWRTPCWPMSAQTRARLSTTAPAIDQVGALPRRWRSPQ